MRLLDHENGPDHASATPPDPEAAERPGTALATRIQAVLVAARYYGTELDVSEFRPPVGDSEKHGGPSAGALSAWVKSSGMWSRAVRLSWKQLMRLKDTGPVVLLLADGGAALLTGVNTEQATVLLKDPTQPGSDPAVVVDELRLARVWKGEVLLLRAERGVPETDAPFTFGWLAALVEYFASGTLASTGTPRADSTSSLSRKP